jgi:tetratricopeptide (TPR) repeat protein
VARTSPAQTGGPSEPPAADLSAFTNMAMRDQADAARLLADAEATCRSGAAEQSDWAIYCVLLRHAYRRTGDPDLLVRAVEAGRTALAWRGRLTTPRYSVLNALALALRNWAQAAPDDDALSEAIGYLRSAANAINERHEDWSNVQNNLTNALIDRFVIGRDPADLNSAIDAGYRSLGPGIRPPRQTVDHPVPFLAALKNRPIVANHFDSLAGALYLRHDVFGDVYDQNAAVWLWAAAVQNAPPDSRYSHILQHHANAQLELAVRNRLAGPAKAVTRMVSRALRSLPRDHPMWIQLLSVRARCHLARFVLGGKSIHLYRALASAKKAAKLCAPTDPAHPAMLASYAAMLETASFGLWRIGRARRRREVVRLLATAAKVEGTAPVARCERAHRWGEAAVAAGDWDSAAEAYGLAVALLPLAAGRHLVRRDRHDRLGEHSHLGVDAAAVALRRGDIDEALTWLEQARGIELAHAVGLRLSSEDRRNLSEEDAAEFDRLLTLVSEPELVAPTFGPKVDGVARRRQNAAKFRALLERIGQANPGLVRLHTPPIAGDLKAVGRDDPVVVVLASEFGGFAIIVAGPQTRAVALPELTAAGALEWATILTTELDDRESVFAANDALRSLLAWEWEVIAEPVLAELGWSAGQPLRRLWWMPTGALTWLPLHAAGHHDGSGRSVMERAVSSYTPTLRALGDGRTVVSEPEPRALVVGVSHPRGHTPLPMAVEEVRLVAAHFGRKATSRTNQDVRSAQVLRDLARVGWAHFACHAVSDPEAPDSGHIVLYRDTVSAQQVARVDARNGFLAYLSACTTSRADLRLADEAVHGGSPVIVDTGCHAAGASVVDRCS